MRYTTIDARRNYNRYHIPSCSNIHRVKRNVIFLNNTNTVRHELAKALGAIMLHRFGDVKFNDEIILAMRKIDSEIKKFGFAKQTSDFLTEAAANGEDRRVDLVDLNTDTRYEFETNHAIAKEGSITIKI